MDTIVNEELMEAVGHGVETGKATVLSVIGGMRVSGRACQIPSLTVAGQTLTNVGATSVRPSDPGIDGLLGQTFLKSFNYSIDENAPTPLVLTRRKGDDPTP
jgi:hypothetical protein